jgi:hypothetical protein
MKMNSYFHPVPEQRTSGAKMPSLQISYVRKISGSLNLKIILITLLYYYINIQSFNKEEEADNEQAMESR